MYHNRVSRNDPCPCGSGKKYKHCCLPKEVAARQTRSYYYDSVDRPETTISSGVRLQSHRGSLIGGLIGGQTLFLVSKTARKNQEQSLTPSPGKSDTVPRSSNQCSTLGVLSAIGKSISTPSGYTSIPGCQPRATKTPGGSITVPKTYLMPPQGFLKRPATSPASSDSSSSEAPISVRLVASAKDWKPFSALESPQR